MQSGLTSTCISARVATPGQLRQHSPTFANVRANSPMATTLFAAATAVNDVNDGEQAWSPAATNAAEASFACCKPQITLHYTRSFDFTARRSLGNSPSVSFTFRSLSFSLTLPHSHSPSVSFSFRFARTIVCHSLRSLYCGNAAQSGGVVNSGGE